MKCRLCGKTIFALDKNVDPVCAKCGTGQTDKDHLLELVDSTKNIMVENKQLRATAKKVVG